ncbi:ATP synthase subunit C lysine N-methyltransferase-like [Liolophura sinensis]|uniref:ATP synthase subunit C lysine N-methyltransferase-like n=1 Tax=Liolophura sinensis TaxID=3198878 RepID=UPI0031584448
MAGVSKGSNDDFLQQTISDETKTPAKLTRRGVVILGISGVVFGGIYAATAPFLTPALRKICLPFVPATTAQVRNVLSVLEGRSGTLIDIGSGDGRIVLEAAKAGFQAYGVELNPWLVFYSKFSAWRFGLSQNAKFFRQDLWKTNLKKYNNIVIFGVDKMMPPLEEKLEKELCKDGCVVACRFPFPRWEPVRTIGSGIDTVWLYRHDSS